MNLDRWAFSSQTHGTGASCSPACVSPSVTYTFPTHLAVLWAQGYIWWHCQKAMVCFHSSSLSYLTSTHTLQSPLGASKPNPKYTCPRQTSLSSLTLRRLNVFLVVSPSYGKYTITRLKRWATLKSLPWWICQSNQISGDLDAWTWTGKSDLLDGASCLGINF